MAASKSVSRKSAAKKTGKTRKSRAAAKKSSKTRKQQVARKKTAPARKKPAAAKKASAPRKTKAAVVPKAKTTVDIEALVERRMPEDPPGVAEIDERIAIVRTNLRELVEQATARSGASDEELLSQRIAEQEAKLALLRKQREELVRQEA
jgi:hypothetical protein